MTFSNCVEEQIVSRAGHIWGLKGFRTEINLASHSRQAAAKGKNIFFGKILKIFTFKKKNQVANHSAGRQRKELETFLLFEI